MASRRVKPKSHCYYAILLNLSANSLFACSKVKTTKCCFCRSETAQSKERAESRLAETKARDYATVEDRRCSCEEDRER